ncbi:MAG: ABC transporter permease [Saccharofermentans sp.]|nr:ABC transporter permease [Saccharofermentans sp.]
MSEYHLVRRGDFSYKRVIICYAIGILVSLGIGALLLIGLGINPIEYYGRMLSIGLIGNRYAYKCIEGLLKVFVPLLITSLALGLAFKMRFWNIGGEGEFLIGSICAAIVAFNSNGMPKILTIILMCLAAALSAGIVGLAVAALKVKFNTNETLMTLMFNYIMLYLIRYLGNTKAGWNFFLNPESERPIFGQFEENCKMGGIKIGCFTLLYSVIAAVMITIIIYIYLKYTKQGYEISVVGDSSATARYAGMRVGRIILRTMFISAALIGLAAGLATSTAGTISESITNNVGWTGVIVAWLAKLSVPGIFITSLLISVLQYGCQAAATQYPSIDSNFADLLQGIILFSVLAADFAATFKIVKKEGPKND